MGLIRESQKFLIVGMGNPEKKYLNTYHNVGFMCMDEVAKRLNEEFKKAECRAITCHKKVGKSKVIVAKPITYMNLTGESVIELVNRYKIEQDKFLVVYDDVDLPLGKIRLRKVGSAGTHNGMKNVVKMCGTQEIYRIRVGIGRPEHPDMQLMNFVLSEIDNQSKIVLEKAYSLVADAIIDFVQGKTFDEIMQKYNA